MDQVHDIGGRFADVETLKDEKLSQGDLVYLNLVDALIKSLFHSIYCPRRLLLD